MIMRLLKRCSVSILLIYLPLQTGYAATCPSDFGSYARGPLNIDNNVTINGNPVVRNTGGNVDGIVPGTGQLENQNPTFTLPALNPASFPVNNSTTDTNSSSIAAGSYDDITVNNNSTTTFTGGTYHIDSLDVGDNATIILAPGTYYIDQLSMGDNSNLIISPAGTVNIFINDEVEISQDVSINASGSAANLTFSLYNNADFGAEQNTTFTGTIYSPFNSTDIEFGDNSNITGGLFTNGGIDLGDDVTLTYGSAEQAAALAVIPCTGGLDHIEITHPGNALTCEPASINVRACATADCSSLYLPDVSVTFGPTGWVGGDTQTISNGTASLQFRNTSAGTVTLAVNSSAPLASNTPVCINSSTGSNDCNLTFYDSGFIYNIPAQTSCQTSTPITISAVRLDDTTQACVPTFNSQTRNVSFSLNYINPGSGTRALTLNYAGTDYTPITNSTSQTVPISFDVNGQATFNMTYPDAGQIALNSIYTGSAGTGDAGLVMNGSATFVNIPAKLYVFADEANSDCAGAVPTCSAFKRAGENFNLIVRAACADNTTTPNFQLNGITISHTNIAPAITQGTTGTSSFDFIATDNGEHVIPQTVSEVGAFTFTATAPDYFGQTVGTPALNTSPEIGRFYPDHFCLTSSVLNNRSDPATASGCSDNFSYLDEQFQVLFSLKAQALGSSCASADITQNYHAAWSKFANPFVDDTSNAAESGKWNLAAVNDPAGTATNLSSRISINTSSSTPASGTFTNGQLDGVAMIEINRAGSAPAYTAETPFTDVHIGMNPIDTDNVPIDTTNLAIGSDNYRELGTSSLYFGRLFASNAFGTNQPDLGLDMYAHTEYCNAVSSGSCTDWQIKTDDSCTLYNINPPTDTALGRLIANDGEGYYQRASAAVTSSVFDFDDDGTAPSYARVHVADSLNHHAGWRLFYTAGGNGGDYLIPFAFPFNSDPAVHPYLLHVDGIASFGQFRGDDRIIYWREILQ